MIQYNVACMDTVPVLFNTPQISCVSLALLLDNGVMEMLGKACQHQLYIMTLRGELILA